MAESRLEWMVSSALDAIRLYKRIFFLSFAQGYNVYSLLTMWSSPTNAPFPFSSTAIPATGKSMSASQNQSIQLKFTFGVGLADMVPRRFASLMVSWMLFFSATSLKPLWSHSLERINWWKTRGKSWPKPDRELVARTQVLFGTKVKPRNKQELVDGIKKFWAKKVMPEKCAKYIDHVLYKAIPAVVEVEGAATKF